MKYIKHLFLCCTLFLLFVCLVPTNAAAEEYTYDVEKYDVAIRVTPQNTYEITENLTVNFRTEQHGIFRKIPLRNDVERTDGSSSTTYARVSDIDCGEDDYSTSRENDDVVIQIGDEDTTLTGIHNYTVSYQYHMGNDVLPDMDEFYYNIIGPGWEDTTIRNVTFSIQMPDSFAEENLGMCYGAYGSENYDDLYYFIEDNTIYGELDSSVTLEPHECVTVRLELPEGYFVKTDTTPWLAWISIGLAIVSMIIAFFMWWFIGRDDPVIETVEYHSPDNLNCLELAFAYRGKASGSDVIPLLIELAKNGYVKIECNDTKGRDFSIMLLKNSYNGSKTNERLFFNGLKKVAKNSVVRKKDLKNTFYQTIESILQVTNTTENKRKLFYKNSLNKSWILFALSAIVFVLAYLIPAYEYNYDSGLAAIGFIPFFLFDVGFYMVFANRSKKTAWVNFLVLALGIGLSAFFVAIPLSYSTTPYIIACILSYVTGVVLTFFAAFLTKRTPYGTEILGRIRGFRRFLETAEKERLEMLVEENPDYFYEILPYTYVLDISDKWMKNFESIACEPPTWYTSNDDSAFDLIVFHSMMNSTITTASNSMTSSPENASSGGGGFSGGGSGGGGGGAW